jgi:hypothetical protein
MVFTANPNDYFIPTTPTLPTTFDLAFTILNSNSLKYGKQNIAIDQSFLSVLEVQ